MVGEDRFRDGLSTGKEALGRSCKESEISGGSHGKSLISKVLSEREAIRHVYNPRTKSWWEDEVLIKIQEEVRNQLHFTIVLILII